MSKLPRLDSINLNITKAEFEYTQRLGIICLSNSPWDSPLHTGSKKTSRDWCSYGDNRVLNAATKPNHYPILFFQDFLAFLCKKAIFSKLDLVSVFHQIPVHPADIPQDGGVNANCKHAFWGCETRRNRSSNTRIVISENLSLLIWMASLARSQMKTWSIWRYHLNGQTNSTQLSARRSVNSTYRVEFLGYMLNTQDTSSVP